MASKRVVKVRGGNYGSPYPCPKHNSYLGRTTPDGWVIVACATPVRERPQEMSYVLVRLPSTGPQKGQEKTWPASRVREQFRTSRGIDPPVRESWTSAGLERARREAIAAGLHIPEPTGLPYPTRKGSTPCYEDHEIWQNFASMLAEREALLAQEHDRGFVQDTSFDPERGFRPPSLYAPVDRQALAEAIAGSPEYGCASGAEDYCIDLWRRFEQTRKPKATFSATREAAVRRREAEQQGVDTSSADYLDTLSEQTRKRKKREAARRNPARPIGSVGNYPNIRFEVPPQVAEDAALGLRLRARYGTSEYKQRTQVGAERARQLSTGKPEVTLRDVAYIRSYLRRHAGDVRGRPFDPSRPTNGWMSWLLWGGNEAVPWVERIYNRYIERG